jgi:hypothetical protein
MEVLIDTAASGDTTLLAAASGYVYKVRQLFLVATGAVAVKFKSGSNSLTGAMALAANAQLILPQGFYKDPWITTNNNEALIINLGGAVQVGGRIVLDKVPV